MLHRPSYIGRYEIKTLIGAGGMGSLYLARDTNPNTNRLVALKLLLANLDSGDLRERFAREARALAALNHPNIVDIYDSGEFQGSPYIVMEYVRGETLAEKIKRRAPMTLGQKLKLMVELCSGLAHAHDAGIIHRDIKPANLMVDLYGRLKVLDFGIARVSEGLTRMGVQVTQLNMRIGTPGYMSPEQIEGGEIDRRSDIFAVGTVCYELLTYREAFTGNSTRQIENKVLQSDPEPLQSLVPDLDPEIEAIVTRALAKDPRDRFQDALALEQAFEQVRWRLGPDTAQARAPRATPPPAAARGSRDSRADIAYQRSVALLEEGAHDAAKRFAIEALAEDPEHDGARTLIQRFGPQLAPITAPRSAQPFPGSEPTVLRTESYVGQTMADAETVLSTGSGAAVRTSQQRAATGARRYRKPLQIAAIVLAVAAVGAGGVFAGLWFWRPGPTLTITRPEGGTLVGDGIRCGTRGSDCSVQLARGARVELRADPDEGFVFAEFTGDCHPLGYTLMSDKRTCGATFSKIVTKEPAVPGVLLTVLPPTGGTIVGEGIQCGLLGKDCSEEYPQGKLVTLSGLEHQDFTFKGFQGDCPRSGSVMMDRARTCAGQFTRNRAAGPGGAPAGTPGAGVSTGNASGGGSGPMAGGSGGSGSSKPSGARTSTAPTPDPLEGAKMPGSPAESPSDAPAKPAPPPPSAEAIAKQEIEEVLEAYRKAYESLDVKRIKQIFPDAPEKNIAYTFKDYKSLEYTYTAPAEFLDLDVALGMATVKRPALLKPEYKSRGAGDQKVNNVFTLKRTGGVWSITQIRYPPK